MKRIFPVIAFLMLTLIISCKKDNNNVLPPPEPPDPPATEIDDARTILLEDLLEQSLPSPYFHFNYDDQHYVTQITFASSYYVYNVEYKNKRVSKLINIAANLNDPLIYSYDNNGLVTELNEYSGRTGNKRNSYKLFYDTDNLLTQIVQIHFADNGASDSAQNTLFTYYPDGNLATINHYYGIQDDHLAWSSKEEFSNYDDKTNVDDFRLLKYGFFDTFLFLPQVKLQKNNPQKHVITSVENDYDVTYTYQYSNNLPVRITVLIDQTRGCCQTGPLTAINQITYY